MDNASPDPEYMLRGVAGIVFGRSYRLLAPTSLGRSPECDICLDTPGVSRAHARLRPLEYGVEVEDLRSTNGSFLNGQRVAVGIARVGDEVAFDELRFRVEATGPVRPASRATATPPRPALRRAWWLAPIAIAVAGALAWLALR